MCFPLVPHHYAFIEFSVHVMCVPLAFSPIAVAFAFAFVSSSRVRVSGLLWLSSKLLLASASILIGCNIAYVAWRLGPDIQIPMSLLQPVNVFAQSLLLTSSALLFEREPADDSFPRDSNHKANGVAFAFVIGALLPRVLGLFSFRVSRLNPRANFRMSCLRGNRILSGHQIQSVRRQIPTPKSPRPAPLCSDSCSLPHSTSSR